MIYGKNFYFRKTSGNEGTSSKIFPVFSVFNMYHRYGAEMDKQQKA